MIRHWRVLAIATALIAGPTLAHEEKGDRAIGLVERITPERIVIKATDGHSVEFALSPETRFSRGKRTATAKDVRVGERAVVHGSRAKEGLTAVEVKLAPPRR